MSDERRRGTWPRLVVGLGLVAAGVLFWLDQIGTIDGRQYFVWWPLALIAVGLANLPERQWFNAVACLIIGTYFLLPLMGLPRLPIWRLFALTPLVFSVVGVTLIVQALRPVAGNPSFRAIAIMAGNVRKIGSQQFTGGEALAIMGGVEIDLTAARIATEAVIDVQAIWGGVEIRVPRDWKVVGKIVAVLGGYVDKTAPAPAGAPRLIIRGSAVMGGVEVKNGVEGAA